MLLGFSSATEHTAAQEAATSGSARIKAVHHSMFPLLQATEDVGKGEDDKIQDQSRTRRVPNSPCSRRNCLGQHCACPRAFKSVQAQSGTSRL